MEDKRFSIKDGSSVGLSSIYTDNGKVMTQLEVLDVLINQHKTIESLSDENEQLKQQLEDKRIEWLRENTVWEQMPTTNKSTTIANDFNHNTISKKWSYYCDKYSCAKCPKREGYQCKNRDWIQ